jgi:hypothetical protein
VPRETVVRWTTSDRPSAGDIRTVLEDYLGALALGIAWDRDRFLVSLPGTPRWPFQRVGPATEAQRASWPELAKKHDGSERSRWFEVWLGDDCMFVMTREMDPVTCAIAEGFAAHAARAWPSRTEDD